MIAERYSIIDVGTNNVLLLLAEKKQGKISIVKRKSEISGLGKDMKNSELNQASINRTRKIINSHIAYSRLFTKNITVIGTSCSREASNIELISNWLLKKFNIKYHIISGNTEAFLIGLANLGEYPNSPDLLLFDVGGGSTEFIYIKNGEIVDLVSLPLGIRRLQNRFGTDITAKKVEIAVQLQKLRKKKIYQALGNGAILVGVGGTVTSLAAIKNNITNFNDPIMENCEISRQELEDIHYKFLKLYHYELKKNMPFDPQRADIVNTGILIVKELVDYLKGTRFFVSDLGLQYGVVKLSIEKFRELFD